MTTVRNFWVLLLGLLAWLAGFFFLAYSAMTVPLAWVFAVSAMSAYVIGDAFQEVFKKFSSKFDATHIPLLFGFVIILPLAVVVGAVGAVIPSTIIGAILSSNFWGIITVQALTISVPTALIIDVFLSLKKSWEVYPYRGMWFSASTLETKSQGDNKRRSQSQDPDQP